MVIIGGMQEHQSIKKDGICTCLTSSMGSGGGYVPMVVKRKEQNMDMFLYNTIKQVCIEDGFNCGEREIKQVYEILHKESSWTIDKIENLLSGLEEKIADK